MSNTIDFDLVFRCMCGDNHYLEINRIGYEGRTYFISFTERPKSFRERLSLLKAIFTNQTVYHGEIYPGEMEAFKKAVAKL